MTALTPYRVSGDESFPCRYTWLPKAVRGLGDNPMLFSNDDQAMVDLGLGKNMVCSVRFWAQAAGMAAPVAKGGGYKPTDFGLALLGSGGLDPFLEDIRTLWLIHWKLPHLQGGIIDDQETAIRALNELVAEMNHRYTVLKENKVSQLTEEDIRACLEYAANRERRLVTVTS